MFISTLINSEDDQSSVAAKSHLCCSTFQSLGYALRYTATNYSSVPCS